MSISSAGGLRWETEKGKQRKEKREKREHLAGEPRNINQAQDIHLPLSLSLWQRSLSLSHSFLVINNEISTFCLTTAYQDEVLAGGEGYLGGLAVGGCPGGRVATVCFFPFIFFKGLCVLVSLFLNFFAFFFAFFAKRLLKIILFILWPNSFNLMRVDDDDVVAFFFSCISIFLLGGGF